MRPTQQGSSATQRAGGDYVLPDYIVNNDRLLGDLQSLHDSPCLWDSPEQFASELASIALERDLIDDDGRIDKDVEASIHRLAERLRAAA